MVHVICLFIIKLYPNKLITAKLHLEFLTPMKMVRNMMLRILKFPLIWSKKNEMDISFSTSRIYLQSSSISQIPTVILNDLFSYVELNLKAHWNRKEGNWG